VSQTLGKVVLPEDLVVGRAMLFVERYFVFGHIAEYTKALRGRSFRRTTAAFTAAVFFCRNGTSVSLNMFSTIAGSAPR
jgi:hypothetical protein